MCKLYSVQSANAIPSRTGRRAVTVLRRCRDINEGYKAFTDEDMSKQLALESKVEHNRTYVRFLTFLLPEMCPMPNSTDDDAPKRDALASRGVLHPNPDAVSDPLFHGDSFFDARDLVQVKYEMLRHVRVDGASIRHAADAAGLSRPTFYLAQTAFDKAGILGLLPAKKGPKRAHKLSDDVLEIVEDLLRQDPERDAESIAGILRSRLDLEVHPRSIDRALLRRRKKGGL
jgi:transposase